MVGHERYEPLARAATMTKPTMPPGPPPGLVVHRGCQEHEIEKGKGSGREHDNANNPCAQALAARVGDVCRPCSGRRAQTDRGALES